jgi:hypothetical protein
MNILHLPGAHDFQIRFQGSKVTDPTKKGSVVRFGVMWGRVYSKRAKGANKTDVVK